MSAMLKDGQTAEIDLARLFRAMRNHLVIVLAGVVLGTGGALAAAFLMTPYYRATVVLSPSSDNQSESLSSTLGSLGGIASLAGVNIGGNVVSPADAALAVLQSRRFTQHFIEEYNLLPVLFARKWDSHKGRWKMSAEDAPDMEDGFERWDDLRGVNTDKKTGLISFWIDWKDPQLAAQWVNQSVAELNAEMGARAEKKAGAYVEYLQQQLDATAVVETRSAIGRLMETQINQRMLAKANRNYAFEVVEVALPPDLDDPVKPKKVFMGIVGALVGLLASIGFAVKVEGDRGTRLQFGEANEPIV